MSSPARSRREMRASIEQTRAVVATGVCPRCGGGLRRNTALAGWWQCQQYGSPQFRALPQEPSCGWQGFTQ